MREILENIKNMADFDTMQSAEDMQYALEQIYNFVSSELDNLNTEAG